MPPKQNTLQKTSRAKMCWQLGKSARESRGTKPVMRLWRTGAVSISCVSGGGSSVGRAVCADAHDQLDVQGACRTCAFFPNLETRISVVSGPIRTIDRSNDSHSPWLFLEHYIDRPHPTLSPPVFKIRRNSKSTPADHATVRPLEDFSVSFPFPMWPRWTLKRRLRACEFSRSSSRDAPSWTHSLFFLAKFTPEFLGTDTCR